MPDPREPQAPDKAKVVLVTIPNEKDRYEVIKALASLLGTNFEEAGDIIKEMPSVLLPSVPLEAGEAFAKTLRDVGAEVEVLPIGPSAGRFCDTHPHRRARARCKEPGCDKYICEICIRESGGKLYCPTCYRRFKRRRILIGLSAVAGVALLVVLWFMFADTLLRMLRYMGPLTTKRVAMVCVTRTMTQTVADYYMKTSSSEAPGKYQLGDTHKLPEIDGWFQKQFESITGKETNIIEIDLYGMYEITGEVPEPSRSERFSFGGAQKNRAFKSFFKKLIKVNRLPLDAYDYILFVELLDQTGLRKDYLEQLGLVRDNFGYVKVPMRGSYSNDYYVMVVAHYLARMMGATLQLDAHGYPLFPSGYAAPNLNPRYPQSQAELMGGYIPTAEYQVEFISSLDQVIIGPHTAYELGWLSRSAVDAAYIGAKK